MNLPPEIAALLAKPSLTDAEQNALARFLVDNQAALSPSDAVSIAGKLGAATTPAGTDWQAQATGMGMGSPSSDPAVDWMQQQPGAPSPPTTGSTSSPLDAIGALLSGAGTTIDSMPDPVGAVLPNIPGLSATGKALLSGQEIPATGPPTSGPGDDLRAEATPGPGGMRLSPDLPAATPPQDFASAQGTTRTLTPPGDATMLGVTANPLPDRGGANDRKAEREARQGARGERTNWKGEDAALRNLPGESAFAGIEGGMLPTLESNPELAADFIARSRGAGDRGGSLIAPQFQALMNLNQTGLYGGNRGVGPEAGLQSSGDRLGAAEALYNQMGPGSYLDPQSLHRETLRNIRRTDPAAMFSGEGEAGDINNQIAVTNSAILASATASMAPDALAAMESRLQRTQDEYIMGVVDGSIIPNEMSYPQWLRTEKKVRKWVGPGTTQEQWQQAFSTE